jgi:hypothetical protein
LPAVRRLSPEFVLIVALAGFSCLTWPKHSFAQAVEAAKMSSIHLKAGAGMDYWDTDYSDRWKFGPAAWAGAELWRGWGLQVEGHSLIGGGDLPEYKYYVGEGGIVYTLHRWHKIEPFAKAELGYGGLSFPRPSSTSHDTRTTWALGAGLEYHNYRRIWTRADFTYDGFPSFLSYVTLEKHTLNPTGITLGVSYHFR